MAFRLSAFRHGVYTEVSDARTLKALKRLGGSLARRRCCTLPLYGIEIGHCLGRRVACGLGRGGRI